MYPLTLGWNFTPSSTACVSLCEATAGVALPLHRLHGHVIGVGVAVAVRVGVLVGTCVPVGVLVGVWLGVFVGV